MYTANRDLMREWNRKLVLSLIREQESISQVEISKKSGLSAGTVNNITRELRKQGFIENVGYGESCGGRKPIIFRFNSKSKYVISVSFFVTETKIAILDLNGNIQKKVSYPAHPEKGREPVFEEFKKQVELLFSQLSISKDKILALCASIEGVVNAQSGTLLISSHSGWRDVQIKKILEELLGLKTFVESEGRAMALGEFYFGEGKKSNNIVCLDIDAGIGAAIVSDGQIHYGAHQMEGEVGHTIAIPDGPLCRCGRYGCLEAVASGSGILKRATESMEKGVQTSLSKEIIQLPEREAIKIILKECEKGDILSSQILKDAAHYLGIAVSNIINYTDPELVVLTGYVSEEDTGFLLKIIQEVVQKTVFGNELREVKIVKGELGEDAVLIGGATLAYKDMFTLLH